MMTIKDIYHGNKAPIDLRFDEESEYGKLSAQWLRLEKEFFVGLTEQQQEMFNKLLDLQGQQTAITNERSYTDGFRNGASLVLDFLNGGEDK